MDSAEALSDAVLAIAAEHAGVPIARAGTSPGAF